MVEFYRLMAHRMQLKVPVVELGRKFDTASKALRSFDMGDGSRILTLRNIFIKEGLEFVHASGALTDGGDIPEELAREAAKFEDLAENSQKDLDSQ